MNRTNLTDSSTPSRDEITEVLQLVAEHAATYFRQLDDLPVRSKNVEEAAKSFEAKLPETGVGAARMVQDHDVAAGVHRHAENFTEVHVG